MNQNVLEKDIERFEYRVGYKPSVHNPITHCEHVMHKKFFDRNPLLTRTADKIAVRPWIKRHGLEEILVDVYKAEYGLLYDIKNIPCIVKANNASGRNLIVRNNKQKQRAIKAVGRWAENPYGQNKGEWCYKDIQPGYIVEPLLWDRGEHHTIYRFLCFHGSPEFVEAHEYEWGNKKKVETKAHTLFSTTWEYQPVTIDDRPINKDQEKPDTLDKMIETATILSEPFDFVRVDLFEYQGKVQFSELTHYPRSGQYKYDPVSYDYYLGSLW